MNSFKKRPYRIVILLFLLSFNNGNAQNKYLKVHSGFGFTDMSHIGVTVRISDKIESGIQGGYFPTDLSYIRTASLINFVNLRYSKKFENIPTTYLKQQLNYYEEISNDSQWTWTTLEILIGSHFNITKSFGISGEFGFFTTLSQFHRRKGPPSFYDDDDENDFPDVFPSIRLQLFVRL